MMRRARKKEKKEEDLINKSVKFYRLKIIYRCDGVEPFSSNCGNVLQIPEEL
jgi:hypothetical protein